MRKIFFAVVLMAVIPCICHGAGYALFTYGVGGEIDEPSYAIELGGIYLSNLHPTGGAFSFGLGVSIGDTDENPPSASAAPSGTNFRNLRDYNDGNEQEVFLSLGAEMVPAIYAVVGFGYSNQDEVTIGVADDEIFEVDSETKHFVPWMIGVRYVREFFTVGVGYHARRGVTASIGIAF